MKDGWEGSVVLGGSSFAIFFYRILRTSPGSQSHAHSSYRGLDAGFRGLLLPRRVL